MLAWLWDNPYHGVSEWPGMATIKFGMTNKTGREAIIPIDEGAWPWDNYYYGVKLQTGVGRPKITEMISQSGATE